MTDKEGLGGLNVPKEETFSEGSDLFHNPAVQKDFIAGSTQKFYPITGVDSAGPFEFNITSDGKHYLLLPQTRLYGTLQVLLANGNKPADGAQVGLVNLFPSSLFKQIEIELNGVQVSDASSSCYGYKSMIETQLSYGIEAKLTHLTAARYYDDTEGEAKNATTSNKGWQKRHNLIKGGKVVDFETLLNCDFFQIYKYLPSGCNLKVKLVRNDDAFSLFIPPAAADSTLPQYMIKILDLHIKVRKVFLHPDLYTENETRFSKASAAILPLVRTQIKTFVIPKDVSSIIESNVIMGQLPRCIILCFVSNAAFNGDPTLNSYYFDHFGLNYVSLKVAGERVPDSGLKVKFDQSLFAEAYRALFDNTGYSHSNSGNGITMESFKNGNTFLAFDLTPDLCNGWHLHKIKQGTVDIELSFKTALTEPINLIVYASYDNKLLLDGNRNITYDFPI